MVHPGKNVSIFPHELYKLKQTTLVANEKNVFKLFGLFQHSDLLYLHKDGDAFAIHFV